MVMNVYSINLDSDQYQSFELVDLDADWEAMYKFNGTPVKSWKPLSVEVFFDEELTEQLPPSDFPSLFADVPVLSGRAVNCLVPYWRDGVNCYLWSARKATTSFSMSPTL
jgi:hypothetical protein